MAANKTQATTESVDEFIAALEPGQQEDCRALVQMLEDISGEPAVLWGKIIGFGSYRYKTANGKVNNWMKIGFSPRKGKLSLYLAATIESVASDLARLGKHGTGKGCIYISTLSDIDRRVLRVVCQKAYVQANTIMEVE